MDEINKRKPTKKQIEKLAEMLNEKNIEKQEEDLNKKIASEKVENGIESNWF